MRLSKYEDGIPIVASNAERAVLFPTPRTGQRVENRTSGWIERWSGSDWEGLVYIDPARSREFKVRNPKYGATGDGTSNDRLAILEAVADIEAANGGSLVFEPGYTYFIDEEVELSADYLGVELTGAIIKGPTSGNVDGTLFAICDRTDLTRVIEHVWVRGGVFQTRQAADNGLAAVAAHHFVIDGVRANLATGLRGIVVQTDSTFTGGSGIPLRHGTVVNCSTYGGGTDGLNVESAGGNLIADLIVENFRVSGATTGLRFSAGSDAFRIDRVVCANVALTGCANGVHWSRVRKGILSNVVADGVTGEGIEARLADQNNWSNLRVIGAGASLGSGLSLTDGTGFTLDNLMVDGAFNFGLYNGMNDGDFARVTLKGCDVGLNTTGSTQRSGYSDFTFESCAVNVNLFRAGDRYQGFKLRSGTTLAALDGAVSADNGDAAATLEAWADHPTQRWATTLTADRAVTLSTTNAYAGAKFHIFRPAGGAFNLNVGTGPLKALPAASWCTVEFDGAAWVLTAYGSL